MVPNAFMWNAKLNVRVPFEYVIEKDVGAQPCKDAPKFTAFSPQNNHGIIISLSFFIG